MPAALLEEVVSLFEQAGLSVAHHVTNSHFGGLGAMLAGMMGSERLEEQKTAKKWCKAISEARKKTVETAEAWKTAISQHDRAAAAVPVPPPG